MFILNILLTVLKIIGIIILVLLGIVLLLLCLLLFVPIKYKVNAGFHGNLKVNAHVTYLFRLLYVHFSLEGTQSDMRISLFGRSISGKSNKPKPVKEASAPVKKAVTTEQQTKHEDKEAAAPVKKSVTAEPPAKEKPIPEKPKQENPADTAAKNTDAAKAEDDKHTEKAKDKPKKEKNKNTNPKSGGIIDTIKNITALLKENKHVLKFLFHQLKLLFRHVLPGSHVIDIRLGLDDPAALGEILGAAAVVRAATGLVINITPVWDEAVFEAEADLKGRIILGRVLYIAARVYFNKDVKKLINAVKNNTV